MYYSWMNDIQDWCISRQLWWGHRIPAWYDQNDKIYVGKTEAAVREKYNIGRTSIYDRITMFWIPGFHLHYGLSLLSAGLKKLKP